MTEPTTEPLSVLAPCAGRIIPLADFDPTRYL